MLPRLIAHCNRQESRGLPFAKLARRQFERIGYRKRSVPRCALHCAGGLVMATASSR